MKIKNIQKFLIASNILIGVLFWPCSESKALDESSFCFMEYPQGKIAACFDGDTFKLTDRRIVRLAGIDAPELGKNGNKCQFFAREARAELNNLALGKKVTLFLPGKNARDKHGRILAEARLENGQSLNELLLENGMAFFMPSQELNSEFQENLRMVQEEAIREKRGMWEKLLSLPLANDSYIGDKLSLRFFPETAPNIQYIKPRNRIYFDSLMDAFLYGYAPDRSCSFWPELSN